MPKERRIVELSPVTTKVDRLVPKAMTIRVAEALILGGRAALLSQRAEDSTFHLILRMTRIRGAHAARVPSSAASPNNLIHHERHEAHEDI